MGFRYRKSIKVLPGVRMTFSKAGVSYSAGGKGFRVTKTASGRVQRTVGIPGTGVYHTKALSSSARPLATAAPPSKPQRPGAFAPKGEKALYNAVQAKDVAALEKVMYEYPEQRVVAGALAGVVHLSEGNRDRARELLAWVLSTGADPTTNPLYVKYVNASFTVPIAPGVSAELTPSRDGLGLLLAELYQEDGNLANAIEIVEGLDPTTVAAVSLAELYSESGRYDDVIDVTNGIVNEDDATALLCAYRGRAFRALGRNDAARESLKEALRSKKRDPAIRHQALIERALTYLDDGKKAQARKDVERVMAEDRSHPDLEPLHALLDLGEPAAAAQPTASPCAPVGASYRTARAVDVHGHPGSPRSDTSPVEALPSPPRRTAQNDDRHERRNSVPTTDPAIGAGSRLDVGEGAITSNGDGAAALPFLRGRDPLRTARGAPERRSSGVTSQAVWRALGDGRRAPGPRGNGSRHHGRFRNLRLSPV